MKSEHGTTIKKTRKKTTNRKVRLQNNKQKGTIDGALDNKTKHTTN
jgi:hypothetical protein